MIAKISSFLLFINRRGSILLADWTSIKPPATPFSEMWQQYGKSSWYKIYSKFIDNQLLKCVIFWHLGERFYLIPKRLRSFVFISTSETGLPFSYTPLYTKPLYPRSGKTDSWGCRQSLDIANLILKQPNLWRVLAKLLECQVLQMTSYGPQDAPGFPLSLGEHPLLCEDHSWQLLLAYEDPEQVRTDPMAL